MHRYTVAAINVPALEIWEVKRILHSNFPDLCVEEKGDTSIVIDLSCFDYESEIEDFLDFLLKHSMMTENERYELRWKMPDYIELF